MWESLQSILGIALAIFYWLFTAGVTLRVITKRRAVSASLAWLLVIYILPVFGAILYLMLGELNLGRQRAARAQAMVDPYLDNLKNGLSSDDTPLPGGQQSLAVHQLLAQRVGIGALGYEQLQVLDTPAQIFASLQADIAQAQDSIRIETYIWHNGGRVDELSEALIAASERGVKVSILIDHAGSRRFFRSRWRKRMVQAGIEVVPALPVRLWRALVNRIDLRLHRKLIVIDDRLAFTGSMNIADPDCFKRGKRVGPWIDTMLRIEGQAAAGLAKVFAWDWEVETGQRRLPVLPAGNERADHWLSILPSGPGIGDDLIGQSVLASIYRANRSIIISTPFIGVRSSWLIMARKLDLARLACSASSRALISCSMAACCSRSAVCKALARALMLRIRSPISWVSVSSRRVSRCPASIWRTALPMRCSGEDSALASRAASTKAPSSASTANRVVRARIWFCCCTTA